MHDFGFTRTALLHVADRASNNSEVVCGPIYGYSADAIGPGLLFATRVKLNNVVVIHMKRRRALIP
jgi:hypothetical protein